MNDGQSLRLGGSSRSSKKISGSFSHIIASGRVHVSEELQQLNHINLPSLGMFLMQESMENFPSEIKHDFLLLESVALEPKRFIKAEKGPDIDGIHITLEGEKPAGETRYEVNLQGRPGVACPVGDIVRILADHDPNDNLFTSSCWDHAFSRALAILEWADRIELHHGLQKEVERLKVRERVVLHAMKGALIKSPSTFSKLDTRELFSRRKVRARIIKP